MGRAPCCDKNNVKRGPWSPEEDAKLKNFIEKHGTGGNWIALPHKAGLKRCGKSCRLRWLNYLRPNIKHGEFTYDEDKIICSLYANIGSRWSIIAGQLPGRTDNDIKNYWNTKLKKKLLAMLPSFQKQPSFFPSIPFQSPQSYKPNQILTNSNNLSPFLYGHTATSTPYNNLMNMNNNNIMFNSLLNTTTTNLLEDHISTQLQDSNTLISLLTNNDNIIANNETISSFYLGFQEDHQQINMYNNNPMDEYQYPTSDVKEAMLMFGNTTITEGAGHDQVSATGSSSEGGSCMSQISYGSSYNQDHHHQKQLHHQHPIKQEDHQFTLQGYGDQSHSFIMNHHSYDHIDQKPKDDQYSLVKSSTNCEISSLHSDLEQVKQLIVNSSNCSNMSYLFNDDNDEYKTTHDHNDEEEEQDKDICYHY